MEGAGPTLIETIALLAIFAVKSRLLIRRVLSSRKLTYRS